MAKKEEAMPDLGVRFLVIKVDTNDEGTVVEADDGPFNQLEMEAIVHRLGDMYLDHEHEETDDED